MAVNQSLESYASALYDVVLAVQKVIGPQLAGSLGSCGIMLAPNSSLSSGELRVRTSQGVVVYTRDEGFFERMSKSASSAIQTGRAAAAEDARWSRSQTPDQSKQLESILAQKAAESGQAGEIASKLRALYLATKASSEIRLTYFGLFL